MSDVETPASEGKALAWTDDAKYQLLLRVVAVFKEDKRSVPWSKINMPGRTTKSLQNIWTKINKEIQDLQNETDGNPSPEKPTPKKSTPRKPRAPKSKPVVDDDMSDEAEAEETPKKVTPKKRASTGGTPSKRAKVVKAEEDVKMASPVKNESEDDPSADFEM